MLNVVSEILVLVVLVFVGVPIIKGLIRPRK
jgi:hypothetical protein